MRSSAVARADSHQLCGARQRHHAPHARARGQGQMPGAAVYPRPDHRCAVSAWPSQHQHQTPHTAAGSMPWLGVSLCSRTRHAQKQFDCFRMRLSAGGLCRHAHASGMRHAGGDEEDTKDRSKQKACLERYRRACWDILAVLHRVAPQVLPLHARLQRAACQ